MRILTHNSLRCNNDDVADPTSIDQYQPYKIEIEDMEVIETDMNEEFIRHLIPSLDWGGLLIAAEAIGLQVFPESYDNSLLEDEDFVKAMHYLLFDVHIVSGYLINSYNNKKYKIENSIPIFM